MQAPWMVGCYYRRCQAFVRVKGRTQEEAIRNWNRWGMPKNEGTTVMTI